ncbi:MAG: hypothetical protein KKF50_02990 [Nanoarchaeota archaeon]|nr:hypothetical protein [Nanoarchaeota archaeon]
MNIVIITQNEHRYLPKTLDKILSETKRKYNYKGVVILPISPFGKKLSFWEKAMEVKNIFGWQFFIKESLFFLKDKIKSKIFIGTSIKGVLKKYGISHLEWVKDVNSKKFVEWNKENDIDVLISLSCNQILKKEILGTPKWGCLNLHGGKLPKYRGLMPSFWTLFNSEKEGAVTIFKMDEGIDSGEIILQKTYPIEKNDRLSSIIVKSKALVADITIESLNLISEGKEELKSNPNSEMSYFGFPTREDIIELKKRGKQF